MSRIIMQQRKPKAPPAVIQHKSDTPNLHNVKIRSLSQPSVVNTDAVAKTLIHHGDIYLLMKDGIVKTTNYAVTSKTRTIHSLGKGRIHNSKEHLIQALVILGKVPQSEQDHRLAKKKEEIRNGELRTARLDMFDLAKKYGFRVSAEQIKKLKITESHLSEYSLNGKTPKNKGFI